MTFLAQRLQKLRVELKLSQAEIGAQGFVSPTGWLRIERGQRLPSETLIEGLCLWLLAHNLIPPKRILALQEELLLLLYLGSKSAFVRDMAGAACRSNTVLATRSISGAWKTTRKRRARTSWKCA